MAEYDDDIAEALAEVSRLNTEAEELAARAGTGTALVPAASGADEAKAVMVGLRHQVAVKLGELKAADQRLKDLIDAKRRALDDERTRMTAALAPLKEQMELLEAGIGAVNLYLGVGEHLVTLVDGPPAPAGTPIMVLQGVLAMDEESAIDPEGGGIDHLRIGDFDAWITARPGRIEQLIPFERGVVAIMPRRAAKDYGDAWANQAHNDANHATYFLIRNGRALYRYIAEGFRAGRRLTPARDEFTAMFTVRRWNPSTREDEMVRLEPGDREWERAEKRAGAVQRHYMSIALILQGLIDRTAVFRPLPAEGLSVLHPEAYERGHIKLLAEDETALTAGRPGFYEWLAAKNAGLRPGQRVVGAFGGQEWSNVNEHGGDRYRDGHSRIRPRHASSPQTGVVYTVDRREGRWLVVLYQRTDDVWRRGWHGGIDSGPAQKRASARILPSDRFTIPFDLVDVAECQWYLQSRVNRHAYVAMIPVLRAVITAKQAEAEAEAPMRQLITGRLMADHDVDYQTAAEAVPALVDWWKVANRWHRPLVTTDDPATEAKALAAISNEFAARRAAVTGDAQTETEMVSRIRTATDRVMLIGRRRDGTWVAIAAQPRQYQGEPVNVWLQEHTWSKTLAGHRVRDWIIPEPSRIARWRILWTGPAWDERDQAAAMAMHLSDPEITDLAAAALAEAAAQAAAPYKPYRNSGPGSPLGGQPVAIEHESAHRFRLYWLLATAATADGDREDGVTGAQMTFTWRRTTGGNIATSYGQLHPVTWRSQPWSDRNPLTCTAADGTAGLGRALAAYEAASQARAAAQRKAWDLRAAIASQWSDDAREEARQKFISEYVDESLWPDHSAGKRFDCPHLHPHGWAAPWEEAVDRLVAVGAVLAGLTVAEMAGLHAERFGDTVEVPGDIAQYRFPGPEGPDE